MFVDWNSVKVDLSTLLHIFFQFLFITVWIVGHLFDSFSYNPSYHLLYWSHGSIIGPWKPSGLICPHLFFFFFFSIGFAIYQNESTTGIHVLPILNPPPSPYHPSGSSQCTSSKKHPVSCIEHGLAIHFTYDIIHVSMPFSQIIPPSPSPTESRRLFYISVSFLLSRIQGYHCHLSKFHIYALVYIWMRNLVGCSP